MESLKSLMEARLAEVQSKIKSLPDPDNIDIESTDEEYTQRENLTFEEDAIKQYLEDTTF